MEVDEIMDKFGFFGKWLGSVYILNLLFLKPPIVMHMISIVWIGYTPPHHCKTPDNSSTHEWIPLDASGRLSSCFMFLNSSNQTTSCLHGWQFDESESGPTIVTKWNLVCDRAYLVNLSQMLLTIGVGIGSVLMTRISDKYGRKWIMILNSFSVSFCALLNLFVDTLELFIVLRFFLGIFLGGSIFVQMVYKLEFTNRHNRTVFMLGEGAIWGLTLALQPLLAYPISNWIYLELTYIVYGFSFLPFLTWWLTETVPWLYANNKIEQAEKVLLWAAKMENVVLSRPILKPLENDENNLDMEVFKEKNDDGNNSRQVTGGKYQSFGINNSNELGFLENIRNRFLHKKNTKRVKLKTEVSVLELFRNRYLLRHLTLAFIICFDLFVYYGVNYTIAYLSFNRFLIAFLINIVELPSLIVIMYAINRFGSKKMIVFYQVMSSIATFACILTLTFEKYYSAFSYATIAFNIIGQFFVSAVYGRVSYLAAEIFPTNLRQQSVGICHGFGRFGAVLANYSPLMITSYPRCLYALYSATTLLGGLLMLMLADTTNRALPETVEDIEAWYKEDVNEGEENIAVDLN